MKSALLSVALGALITTAAHAQTSNSVYVESYQCSPWDVTVTETYNNVTYLAQSFTNGNLFLENGSINYEIEDTFYVFMNGSYRYELNTYPGPAATLRVTHLGRTITQVDCDFLYRQEYARR